MLDWDGTLSVTFYTSHSKTMFIWPTVMIYCPFHCELNWDNDYYNDNNNPLIIILHYVIWLYVKLSVWRKQKVEDVTTSSSFSINSSVPQGSVLSPSIFLLFINDLLRRTANPIHSYADNSTLDFSFLFILDLPKQNLMNLTCARLVFWS